MDPFRVVTFLPIAERELRVAARRRNTFWTRVGCAGVAVFVSAWSVAMAYLPGNGQPGEMMFGGVTFLAYWFCVLGGLVKTADSLSEEKRDGTLGLLFLTDLRGYDVVLGKLVATSLLWFYGLLAVFPVLAASMLFGGVAPGEFWRVLLALLNLLFLSLATGLFASSISRNDRRAMVATACALFLMYYVPEWLGTWHRQLTGAREIAPGFLVWSPGHAFDIASDVMYGRRAGQYWSSLGLTHLIGWFLIALSSGLVVRTWQDRVISARAARFQTWQRRWRLGTPARRAAFRRRALERNPYCWLTTRVRWKAQLAYAAIVLVAGLMFLDWWSTRNRPLSAALASYAFLGAMVASLFKIWVALEAGWRFVDDRRSGAMELLLCTPLTVGEIIRGQRSALHRQFLGPTILILLLAGVLLGLTLNTIPRSEWWQRTTVFLVWGIVLVADLFALSRLGMWFGLTSRHVYWAAGRAVLFIQVLPWVMFYCGVLVLLTLVNARGFAMGTTTIPFFARPEFFVAVWCGVSLLVAVPAALWASQMLRRKFRERVMGVGRARWRFARAATPALGRIPRN